MSYSDRIAELSRYPLNIISLGLDNPVDVGGDYFCDYQNPLGQKLWPCVESINYTPAKLIPGALGSFGSITVTLKNFSIGSGTFFGKLLALNDYFLDRTLSHWTGFYDGSEAFDWANFQERKFSIRSIKGPDSRGRITVTATDILTKLNSDQAVAPLESYGELSSPLSAATTGTTNITDNTNFSASGGLCIINGNELATYSGISGLDSIVLSARSQLGTVAESSVDAGAPVKNCFFADTENCVDVIYDLIDTYSDIDAATYINSTDWGEVRDNYLASNDVYFVKTEPTAVKKIISEVCRDSHLSVWWEPEASLIKIRAVGPQLIPTKSIDTTAHILRDGHSVDRDPSKAITRVLVYYGKINHSKSDEESNFKKIKIVIDNAKESEYGFEKIETIFAGTLPENAAATASSLGHRILSSYGFGEIASKFQLDAKDSELLAGENVSITSVVDEDSDGSAQSRTYMVVERDQKSAGNYAYKALALGIDPSSNYAVIADNSTPDYDSGGKETGYAFFCDEDELMPNDVDIPYLFF